MKHKPMIVLVCGGRNFSDQAVFDSAMNDLPLFPELIIQGGASGADYMAKQWAEKYGVHCAEVKALWDYHGRKAGPLRNSAMLILQPAYCIALPGGKGTANMISQCEASGIPVRVIT